MNQAEKTCYQILKDSEKILNVSSNISEKIRYFLESIDGCAWIDRSDPVQIRQFETCLKTWFKEFEEELLSLAKNNKPQINGKYAPFLNNIGFHTMDDFGFEGQIMGDGSFYRWIEESMPAKKLEGTVEEKPEQKIPRPYENCTDSELESKWQGITNAIQRTLMKAYSNNCANSNKLIAKSKKFQKIQDQIQEEITRRGR